MIRAADNELRIYEVIGDGGITATDFAEALDELAGASQITVRINSPGGYIFDGVTCFTLLSNHPARVDVVVDGIAASIASLIMCAGDTITASAASTIMIHQASSIVYGRASDMAQMRDTLEKLDAMIAEVYAARSGRPAKLFRQLMADETWLSASEAKDVGLVDTIVESKVPNMSPDPAPAARYRPAARWDQPVTAAEAQSRVDAMLDHLAVENARRERGWR